MKKAGMIFGGLVTIFGLSIMATPLRTYFLLGWIAGCVFLFNGLSLVFSGLSKHNRNLSKCVVGSVTALIGVVLLVTDLQQILTQALVIYLVAGGILLSGVVECVAGYVMTRYNQNASKTFILGGISIALGVAGLVFKDATVIIIGVVVGYHIVRLGMTIFNSARNLDSVVIVDM